MSDDTLLLTRDQLLRILDLSGESHALDCKGPVHWDGAAHSASLTKDIIANANAKGGGLLVIGKSQGPGGSFVFDGLSDDQAATFDTTRVATWVNHRTSAPVKMACCPVVREGKRFVVIHVAEYDDLPIMCTRDVPHPDRQVPPLSPLLRQGAIYVRTVEAASVPLARPAELRALIALATSKQRDQIAATVRAVMTGTSIIPPPPPEELYSPDRQAVDAELAGWLDRVPAGRSGWRFDFYPKHRRPYWADEQELHSAARRWIVDLAGSQFPANRSHLRFVEGAVVGENDWMERFVAVTPHGFGTIVCGPNDRYNEERRTLFGRGIEPGTPLLPLAATIDTVGRFFLFLAGFAGDLPPEEPVIYRAYARGMKGRRLWTDNFLLGTYVLDAAAAVKDPNPRARELPAGAVGAAWRDECAAALTNFFGEFRAPHGAISQEMIRRQIDTLFHP